MKHFKNIDENMKLLEETQVAHNKRFNEKISEIEKLISKNISSDSTKTSNLTFEEAITAFKAGKNIRFNDGLTTSTTYGPRKDLCYGFAYSYICQDHWEIVE